VIKTPFSTEITIIFVQFTALFSPAKLLLMQESETITAERGNGPPKDKKSDGEQKEKSIYKGG
jgi:hypothetical protein